MNARRPPPRAAPLLPGPVFGAPRPDHVPPEALSAEELNLSIVSLRRKLRSARQSLALTRAGGTLLSVALLVTGFVLLWFGPAPILERVFGAGAIATTYGVFLWWSAAVAVCVLGGVFGDRLLRGRLRLARGWAHRVEELRHRLAHAEAERQRRQDGGPSATAPDPRTAR